MGKVSRGMAGPSSSGTSVTFCTRTNISTAVPISESEAEEAKSESKDGGLTAILNKKIF